MLALLVAGCATPTGGAYRDTAVPISASTRFAPESFAGEWRIAETFGPVRADRMLFEVTEAGVRVSGTGIETVDGLYREGVPGELIPATAGRAPLVVMWIDATGETAAIGTPSGRFGALIDRDGRIPPDKALAGRAILDFYGWDISQLARLQT